MKEKTLALLGSIRFYVVTLGWLADYLADMSANGFDAVILLQQISYWLATVAAIGTADSIAKKFRKS